ncbi:hypothetical protein F4604DRAFT_637170 [Suillus subluteus]|nr:hypothetical protein F4604DRAFT_637170 [Suillus subluteus]
MHLQYSCISGTTLSLVSPLTSTSSSPTSMQVRDRDRHCCAGLAFRTELPCASILFRVPIEYLNLMLTEITSTLCSTHIKRVGSCRNLELSNFERFMATGSFYFSPYGLLPKLHSTWRAQRLNLKVKFPTGRSSADVRLTAFTRILLHHAITSEGATLATTLRVSTRRLVVVHDSCYDSCSINLRHNHRLVWID